MGAPRHEAFNSATTKSYSAAVGVARSGHREDVVAEPADQQRDIVGQGHGGITGGAGPAQELSGASE